jgi:hypothetical protein
MSRAPPLRNHVKQFCEERGWARQELAERAGFLASASAPLKPESWRPPVAPLARVFGCTIEELFQVGGQGEIAQGQTSRANTLPLLAHCHQRQTADLNFLSKIYIDIGTSSAYCSIIIKGE